MDTVFSQTNAWLERVISLMKSTQTVSSICRLLFVIAGFKNKPFVLFSPHLRMPPLLLRPIPTIITFYLLYVITGSSHLSQPLTLSIGRGSEERGVKARVNVRTELRRQNGCETVN